MKVAGRGKAESYAARIEACPPRFPQLRSCKWNEGAASNRGLTPIVDWGLSPNISGLAASCCFRSRSADVVLVDVSLLRHARVAKTLRGFAVDLLVPKDCATADLPFVDLRVFLFQFTDELRVFGFV